MMTWFNDLNLRVKLLVFFLIVGLTPFISVSSIAYLAYETTLRNQIVNQLEGVRETKKKHIENYFDERKNDVTVAVETVQAFWQQSSTEPEAVQPQNQTPIISPKVPAQLEAYLAKYAKAYGYYDVKLVAADGTVFYSMEHESDYKSNIFTGQYKNSGLARITKKVFDTRGFAFEDFDRYAPSANRVSAFIGAPVVDAGKNIFAVVIMQLSPVGINRIMMERTGLGETGESYLVGPDYLMRSDSILNSHHKLQAAFDIPETGSVKTLATEEGLQGKTGAKIMQEYTGQEILAVYTPVKVYGDSTWVLITKLDTKEAFAPITQFARTMGIIGAIVLQVVIMIALLVANFIAGSITTSQTKDNRKLTASELERVKQALAVINQYFGRL